MVFSCLGFLSICCVSMYVSLFYALKIFDWYQEARDIRTKELYTAASIYFVCLFFTTGYQHVRFD